MVTVEQMKILTVEEFNRRWRKNFTHADYSDMIHRWPSSMLASHSTVMMKLCDGEILPPQV